MTIQSMLKMPAAMPGQMNMPMHSVMPMIMATSHMRLGGASTRCECMPAPGMDPDTFQSSCELLRMMVDAGMPIIMQAGNMSMMCISDSPMMTLPMLLPSTGLMPSMLCSVDMAFKGDTMLFELAPGRGMDPDVFHACCKLMDKLMQLGMPMMITCNGSAVMCCTA